MTPLEELARRCGIALTFNDGFGAERRVAPATLQSVLSALGVDAGSEQQAAASLEALERGRWQEVVPPVVVAHASNVAVEVTLAAATRVVSWHLQLENGAQLSGAVPFGELALVARDEGDSRAGLRKERRRLHLGNVPLGYHRLTLEPQSGAGIVVVTPGRCFLPSGGETHGLWGIALQLYLLKSQRNLGIGDFGDLAALAAPLAQRGCDVLGLNPLHAPFPDNPEHASPYSPASRLLLNPLNIDVADVADSPAAAALLADGEVAAAVAKCRAATLVDYGGVAALKERVLRAAFEDWQSAGGDTSGELAVFRAARGTAFERHCLYFALRAQVLAENPAHGDWRSWPQPFRDPRSSDVARFKRSHAHELTWVAWQQWHADRQLARAAAAANGMAIGFYRDLAVGCDAAGAETWAGGSLLVEGLRIGAPPDPGAPRGQEWGLPPPHPQRWREGGYGSFVDLLRANMRHAGALRIDHVMALERLYVVPAGAPATDGTYLSYPVADLLGLLALESMRGRCVIVGEDLGSVPPGFRERMAEANVLSYRVMRFERHDQRFLGPQEYPPLAVAVFGNHDLSTLRAWWEGADLALAREHGALHGPDLEAAQRQRETDRGALLDLLRAEGVLVDGSSATPYDTLFAAVHAVLGRARALLVLAQLDDVLGEIMPVNSPVVPGYASWRRRYSQGLEQLSAEPLLAAAAAAFGARGAGSQRAAL